MNRILTVLTLSVAATAAVAQAGPSTAERPCGADRALVDARGAAVLNSGPGLYNRYVMDTRYCQIDQYPVPAYVPSLDSAQCFVGYRCRSDD